MKHLEEITKENESNNNSVNHTNCFNSKDFYAGTFGSIFLGKGLILYGGEYKHDLGLVYLGGGIGFGGIYSGVFMLSSQHILRYIKNKRRE